MAHFEKLIIPTMKIIICILLIIPLSLLAIEKNDSTAITQHQIFEQLKNNEKELTELKQKLEIQENLNEKTINGISVQLDAASYNLTIFGILFAIAAIILGVYITRIENKVVRIREENKSLLNQTIKNKEEVVAINALIQKDIYGLFLKIKREETVHLLNRLLIVPKDISNLSQQLLSRELEKADYKILKSAYQKLKDLPDESGGLGLTYRESYKLLFFQHFLELAIQDEDIGNDLIDFYPTGINCAFENDMIKSTKDFIKAIIYLGYQFKDKEINSFIKGISLSRYKNFNTVYKILFDGLINRENQFKFFNLISDEKNCRIGKSNYGKLLINSYSSTELSVEESTVINKTNAIIDELKKEELERKALEEKRIAEAAARKKQQELKLANKEKKE